MLNLLLLIGRLQKKGIKTVLLSGDREEAVATVAKAVGIEEEFVHSSLTPQKKSELISTLKAAGHRVAMVLFYKLMNYLLKSLPAHITDSLANYKVLGHHGTMAKWMCFPLKDLDLKLLSYS